MIQKKTVLLFDIDGTLTPPRRGLPEAMAQALDQLNVPFHVAAGSDLALVEPQFLKPLWESGFRRDFEAFVNNGAAHYACNFSQGYSLDPVTSFDFKQHLGEEDFKLLLDEIQAVLKHPDYALDPPIDVIGRQLKDRGSMVNFTPIGRPDGHALSDEAIANREAFVEFDRSTDFRRRVVDRLSSRLSRLIEEKNLRIMLGGETSFDIVIKGRDKTFPVRKLMERGCERIVFIGDALFPGGNDSVILDFIREWKDSTPCPLEAIRVGGWEETLKHFKDNGWI